MNLEKAIENALEQAQNIQTKAPNADSWELLRLVRVIEEEAKITQNRMINYIRMILQCA